MVDRRAAKAAAKETMRSAKVNPLLVSLVLLVIIYILNSVGAFVDKDPKSMLGIYGLIGTSLDTAAQTISTPPGVFANILVYLILLILEVGFTIYCLGIAHGREMPVTSLFDGFSIVGRVIILAIVQFVFIFLWSCLLIVPGIIAVYRYRFAFYNLIEYGVGPMEALNMSKKQTYGFKMSLFLLDLSFIGWSILSILTLSILNIWLAPYYRLSDINYYFTAISANPVDAGGSDRELP
jgi:uncharacterized membrane protein